MESVSTFRSRDTGEDRSDGVGLSKGLGWFSVGLGLTELAIPASLARAIGISPSGRTPTAVRAMGVRELLHGLGILMRPRRAAPLWARVVGDVLDIALLSWAAKSKRTSTERLVASFVALAGTTALDLYASTRQTREQKELTSPVIYAVTINRPPAEVYAFWRKLDNLPRFMDYLASVTETGGLRSRWVAKTPVGVIKWEAEITEDRPGELIAWQTVDSKFAHRGQVTFARAPGRNATEVRIELAVGLPGVKPSAMLAKLLTTPQIKGDLRRFKQVVETDEVLYSDSSLFRRPHPAQPSEKLPDRKGLVP